MTFEVLALSALLLVLGSLAVAELLLDLEEDDDGHVSDGYMREQGWWRR